MQYGNTYGRRRRRERPEIEAARFIGTADLHNTKIIRIARRKPVENGSGVHVRVQQVVSSAEQQLTPTTETIYSHRTTRPIEIQKLCARACQYDCKRRR